MCMDACICCIPVHVHVCMHVCVSLNVHVHVGMCRPWCDHSLVLRLLPALHHLLLSGSCQAALQMAVEASRTADSILNHTLKNTMADAAGDIEMFLDTHESSSASVQHLRQSLASLRKGMRSCRHRQAYLQLAAQRFPCLPPGQTLHPPNTLTPTNKQPFTMEKCGAIFPITFNDGGGIFPALKFSGQKFSRTEPPPCISTK